MPDEELPLEDQTETEEQPEETEASEETEETPEETEEELPEAHLKEAKALYKLLKDPNTQFKTIQALAATVGVIGRQAPETSKEVREAKKDIKELIKEKLGKDYEFFAPKLGEVIEAVLEQEREQYAESLQETQLANLNNQVESALARLSKETQGASKKLENQIAKLCERYPQPENSSIYDYLKEMYQLAGGKVTSSDSQRIVNKIQQNAKDVPGRLRTHGSGAGGKEPVIPDNKPKGLKAIVQAQMDKINKG